ncbi:transposase, partial [Mycobacterium sp. ENV421]|uniref:IS110 family transposase n=1 Tax=Mycobacterium sp. ENV421 TaxID=1213407 RepID=UPI001E313A85
VKRNLRPCSPFTPDPGHDLLEIALDPATVIVAVDPGKAFHRVWISNGSGLLADPMSLSVSREGISQLELALNKHGPERPVIAIEATGSLHRPWVAELERRHPGSVRLFAPSETKSARTQLGSGRFKTDDRDCAALTYMARQGGGRRYSQQSAVEALRAAVRHRRGLVADRKVRSAAVARPAQCPLSWIVSADRSWAIAGAGDVHWSCGTGVRCRVCRTTTAIAVTDLPGPGPIDDQHRPILATAVAQVSASAG